MKRAILILSLLVAAVSFSQTTNPGNYCVGNYATGDCSQPGASNSTTNFINDFIDCVKFAGASVNFTNCNSGCSSDPNGNNYMLFCNYPFLAQPGQVLTAYITSGIIFPQGFAIWVDWDQDNVFSNAEYMAGSAYLHNAATEDTLSFTIPSNIQPGSYRLRIRCTFANTGAAIDPCQQHSFGETEDYVLNVGGSTPPTLTVSATSPNATLCVGQTLSLTGVASLTTGVTYTWTGPGSYSTNLQNPTIQNVAKAISGVYTVTADHSGCPTSATIDVLAVPYPSYSLTNPSPTICQGGNFHAAVQFIGSGGGSLNDYSFVWVPGSSAGVSQPAANATQIFPPLLPQNVSQATKVYSVIVTPTVYGCPIIQWLTVTINNPLTPTLTTPAPLCNIDSPLQLSALPLGGLWSWSKAVTPGGLYAPAQTVSVPDTLIYSVSVGQCVVSNSMLVTVSKFNTAALSTTLGQICVQDAPISLMTLPLVTSTGIWNGIGVSNNNFDPQGLPTGNYNLTYSTQSVPLNTCPHSTVLSVYVFNPPKPVFTPIPALCTNAHTIQINATPPNGWFSSPAGVSASGVMTPSLSSIGDNTVRYTAGSGTCVASSTVAYHISQFNPATLKAKAPDLCVNSSPIDLKLLVVNSNGNWSGTGVNSNTFSPSGLATKVYKVVYTTTSTPRANLCPDQSTLSISVLNPPTPTITQVGPYCTKDGTVALSVTPRTGTWTSTFFLSHDGIFSPGRAAVGDNIVQYVTGTSTCSAQDSRTINVQSFVPATITSKLPDMCVTNAPYNLLPFAASSTGTWSGPGMSGMVFTPSVAGAGKYILTYSTASVPSGLCPDQATLAVSVYSLAQPKIEAVDPKCNNAAPFDLVVTPLGGLFGSPQPGVVSVKGLFDPSAANIGENIVDYTVTSGPCVAFAQRTITIEKFVSAAFDKTISTVCRNEKPINLNSFVKNPGGTWGGVPPHGMFDPLTAQATTTISYSTRPGRLADLCPDQSTISIEVIDLPELRIHADKLTGCAPFVIQANLLSVNFGQASWNFGDATENEEGRSVRHQYDLPGTYTVQMNYDHLGCKTSTTLPAHVFVYESPNADFEFSNPAPTTASPRVQLINRSTPIGNNKYEWTVQDQPSPNALSPEITLPRIGSYAVTLSASNVHGCRSSTTKFIELKNEFGVYIPNVFTPNDDGKNDGFRPEFSEYGLDENSYVLEIYDRWGALVFKSFDKNEYWNGMVNRTTTAKEGVYVYNLKFKDLDGKTYFHNGSVTLISNQQR